VRRISVVGSIANLVGVGLVCLTGAAFAGPSLPGSLTGVIVGLSNSTISLSNIFIDTLNPIFVSSTATFYNVYATVMSLVSVSGSGVATPQVIGEVLVSAVQTISSQGTSILATLDILNVPSTLNPGSAALFLDVLAAASIPEPNSLALVVTGVAGLATLLRRRKLRRRG
jgi:hypothetical protein